VAGLARPAAAADPDWEAMLAERAPTIVTIKYVMKSQDWESTNETRGVLVDAAGLVMTAGLSFRGEGTKISDVKVMLGADPAELDAVIVAHDTVLSLGYVRILAPPEGKPLAFVDLAKGRDPKVGQSLFGVTRAGRGFDFAPAIKRLYLTSRIETPRGMWNFAGEFNEEGLPVYDLEGKPAGVIASQSASEGTDDGTDTFVLPLKDVLRSLEQAKKRVPDALAKAKESKEAREGKDAEPAMDAAPAMDDGSEPKSPPAPPKPPDSPPR
jgi:hypothetical protein